MVRNFYLPLGIIASCIIAGSLIWTSCDDREPCSRCGQITSAFIDKRFRVFIGELDTFLIYYDSLEKASIFFPLCSSDLLSSLETENVVEVSGSFRNQCSASDIDGIEVNEIQWLSSCLPPIAQLNGPYDLDNRWFIHYVQTPDTLLYPPCEGDGFIVFDTSERTIHSHPSINSCIGTYAIVNDSTLLMPTDFGCTLGVGNNYQSYFENVFNDVLKTNSSITYSINKNILVLKYKADNSMIRLFLTE